MELDSPLRSILFMLLISLHYVRQMSYEPFKIVVKTHIVLNKYLNLFYIIHYINLNKTPFVFKQCKKRNSIG